MKGQALPCPLPVPSSGAGRPPRRPASSPVPAAVPDAPLLTVYDPAYLAYDFGPGHPFTPLRQAMLVDLLAHLGVDVGAFERPVPSSPGDIRRIHAPALVEAVEGASSGGWNPVWERVGIGTGDVPGFAGMDAAARTLCGGTVHAADAVATGRARRPSTLGGGLHHAHPGHAAGFCVYNDHALGIKRLRGAGLRVAYVDVDVHHGDGVEAFFEADADVLTLSLHESGDTLYPGTGRIEDRGRGAGRGSVVNVPLAAGTADASYLVAFDAVVPDAIAAFGPDVLVVEAGGDAHRFDPLAHLALSTHAFEAVFRRLVDLADRHCGGRLVVTLGGGYHLDAVVRIWAILWHVLADRPLPVAMPEAWRAAWQPRVPVHLTATLHDAEARPSRPDAAAANEATVARLRARPETA